MNRDSYCRTDKNTLTYIHTDKHKIISTTSHKITCSSKDLWKSLLPWSHCNCAQKVQPNHSHSLILSPSAGSGPSQATSINSIQNFAKQHVRPLIELTSSRSPPGFQLPLPSPLLHLRHNPGPWLGCHSAPSGQGVQNMQISKCAKYATRCPKNVLIEQNYNQNLVLWG